MARSLNRVQLIGNLTRDPELRYTPSGTAVCSFGLATNRSWTTDNGDKHEESEFHRIVAWNKLAELCSQFLVKGRKVYVEGRLATRNWTTQEGQQRSVTEVVIDDMILLDKPTGGIGRPEEAKAPAVEANADAKATEEEGTSEPKTKKGTKKQEKVADDTVASASSEENVNPDDIPF